MSVEGLRLFLFLPQGELRQLDESYIAVKQAHINDAIAEQTERVGGYGILFTTMMDSKEVKQNLNTKEGEEYLLIELTGNIDEDTIAGFFPNTDIVELKILNLETLKDKLNKAVSRQDFETAQEIKDEIDKGL